MSEHERQEFLAGVHVGVISIERFDGPPLTVPIGYGYEPRALVWIITGAESFKGRLLDVARRFSLCVQAEEPPFYKYVSVEGPASFGEPDREKDVRETAIRYLGKQMGEMYLAMIEADPEPSVLVVVKPQRWYSVDYSKLG